MYLRSKKVIRYDRMVYVRIKSLDWDGKYYGLEEDGDIIARGNFDYIKTMYNAY